MELIEGASVPPLRQYLFNLAVTKLVILTLIPKSERLTNAPSVYKPSDGANPMLIRFQ